MSTIWEMNYFFTISKPMGVMKCCIMLSLDYSFCLMHMFEIFEFVFVVCLVLNSKEENKIKGIRTSGIKRKGKEA